jgi:hypothetical protein
MTSRTVVDSQGVEWRVSATYLSTAPRIVTAQFRPGWLTFESHDERRHIGPVPDNWESAPADHLAILCDVAEPVRDVDSVHVVTAD